MSLQLDGSNFNRLTQIYEHPPIYFPRFSYIDGTLSSDIFLAKIILGLSKHPNLIRRYYTYNALSILGEDGLFVVDSALPYFLKRTCSTFDIRVAFSLIEQIPELGVNKDINETITAYSKIDYGMISLLAKRLLSGNTKPLLGSPTFYEPPIEYKSYWATEGYILNYFIELKEEYIKCLDDLRHLSTKKYYQKNRGEIAYHRTDPKGELTPVVAWHYEICETALDQALSNALVSAWKDGSYNHNVDIVTYILNSLTSFDISIGKALIPRPDINFPSKSETGVSITQLVHNDWVRAAHIELEKQIAWNRHNDKGGIWLSSSFIIRQNEKYSPHILSQSLPMVDKITWLDELEDTPEYEVGAPLFSLLKIGNISFAILVPSANKDT